MAEGAQGAAATEVGRLIVRLLGDSTSFQRMLDTAQRQVKATAGVIQQIGQKIESVKKRLDSVASAIQRVGSRLRAFGSRLSLFVTAPLVAFGASAAKAAIDAEETASKFNVVFREVIDNANTMAVELDKSFGLSADESRKLLSNTADLLSGFGFTQKEALALSGQVQKLAVDLASFSNVAGGATAASEALTAGLLGERERMKALGIAINENTDQWKKMLAEVEATEGVTGIQAKALATLRLAMIQSKNAIGDYARTSDSAANQTRELMADFHDLRVEIGRALLPQFRAIVKFLRDVIRWFKEADASSKAFTLTIVALSAAAAALGPILITLGSAATLASTAISASAIALKGVALLFTPAGAIGVALAAGIFAWAKYSESGQRAMRDLGNAMTNIKGVAIDAFKGISDALKGGDIETAGQIVANALELSFRTAANEIRKQFEDLLFWFKSDPIIRALVAGATPGVSGADIKAVQEDQLRAQRQQRENVIKALRTTQKELLRRAAASPLAPTGQALSGTGISGEVNAAVRNVTATSGALSNIAKTLGFEMDTVKAIGRAATTAFPFITQAAQRALAAPVRGAIGQAPQLGVFARQAVGLRSVEAQSRVAEFRAGAGKGNPAKDTKNLDDIKINLDMLVAQGRQRQQAMDIELANFL